MGKILYPVGTPVTVRKSPKTEGLIVTQYVKGEKYPYRVGFYPGDQVIVGEKYKFSKAGLKRYSPTQAKVEKSTTVPQDVYTKNEVDDLIKHTTEYVLGQVNSIAFDLRSAILISAEMTDSNFRKTAKQFKTLNHDDD